VKDELRWIRGRVHAALIRGVGQRPICVVAQRAHAIGQELPYLSIDATVRLSSIECGRPSLLLRGATESNALSGVEVVLLHDETASLLLANTADLLCSFQSLTVLFVILNRVRGIEDGVDLILILLQVLLELGLLLGVQRVVLSFVLVADSHDCVRALKVAANDAALANGLVDSLDRLLVVLHTLGG